MDCSCSRSAAWFLPEDLTDPREGEDTAGGTSKAAREDTLLEALDLAEGVLGDDGGRSASLFATTEASL